MDALFLSKFRKQLTGTFALCFLVLSLLGTHWLGFAHGISHSGLSSQSVQLSCVDQNTKAEHSGASCHLYDALTLAGFITSESAPLSVLAQFNIQKSVVDLSISARVQSEPYQSRAPPSLTL